MGYTEGSANPNNFPEDHPWWKRNAQGNHVLGWIGGNPRPYLFNLDLPAVRQHCANSVVNALDTGVFDGAFLDVFSDDSNHVDILRLIRAQRPNALLVVNCNYRICPNVAPLVDGFYMECGVLTTSAQWAQVIATLNFNERHVRQPALNCLEISGPRDNVALLRAVTCLSLALSNGCFCYSDPVTHIHGWPSLWDLKLGRALGPPQAFGTIGSQRTFEHGTAYFTPPPGDSYIV